MKLELKQMDDCNALSERYEKKVGLEKQQQQQQANSNESVPLRRLKRQINSQDDSSSEPNVEEASVSKDKWLFDFLTGNGQLEEGVESGSEENTVFDNNSTAGERSSQSTIKPATGTVSSRQQSMCICPPGK